MEHEKPLTPDVTATANVVVSTTPIGQSGTDIGESKEWDEPQEKSTVIGEEEEEEELNGAEEISSSRPVKIVNKALLDADDSSPKARRASTSILPPYGRNLHKQEVPESQWKPSEADEKAVLPLLNTYKVHTFGEYEDIDLFTQDILPRLTSTVATIISITKVKQQGNYVFMYTIQVCKKTVHGTIEIHLVSRSLKSFYDFHKLVKKYV